MSGSSSGPGPVSSGTGGNCNIIEAVVLESPNPEIVKRLKVGINLSVEVRQVRGSRALVACDHRDVAGAMRPRQLAKFIRCIDEGFEYEARVTRISGGTVMVEIRPAK